MNSSRLDDVDDRCHNDRWHHELFLESPSPRLSSKKFIKNTSGLELMLAMRCKADLIIPTISVGFQLLRA